MSENEITVNGINYVAVPLTGKGCDGCIGKVEGSSLCKKLPVCNRLNRADKRSVVFVEAQS